MTKTIIGMLPALLGLSALAARAQPTFTISTVAGNGTAGYSGYGGPAISAAINDPRGVTVDAAGNIYIAALASNRIRKVSPDGTITTVAGTGRQGFSGDGGPAISAELNQPIRVEVDRAGNLYIADGSNYRIRKVDIHGIITTVAGNGSPSGPTGDGGLATSAGIAGPGDATPDAAGNLFVVEGTAVRKVDTHGIITTVAGNGTRGYSGDGGPAVNAQLNNAVAVTVDAAGSLYISDQSNHRIRKVTNGIITTVAGNGAAGFSGDGGQATAAQLYDPVGTGLDAAGNLYIADAGNDRIRVVLTNGTIWTVAGDGSAGYGGDGGPATLAALSNPHSAAITSSGSLYFADDSNERIRLLTPVAQIPSMTGVISASGFGGFSSIAPGTFIEIYGASLASDTRGWAGADFNGINAPTSLDGTSVSIGGQNAFISYISPAQVNALVPSTVQTGPQQITVKTAIGTSTPFTVNVNALEPGLLAIPSFNINGTPYTVALFPDGTFVLPTGAISGINSRPAKPGDVIVLYGIGFGPVTPYIPAGQLAEQTTSLATGLRMFVGGISATTLYAGLAPSFTGLYQFNIMVPAVAASNAVPLTFTLNGVLGTQVLNIAVAN